jgi:hypothetical protein
VPDFIESGPAIWLLCFCLPLRYSPSLRLLSNAFRLSGGRFVVG